MGANCATQTGLNGTLVNMINFLYQHTVLANSYLFTHPAHNISIHKVSCAKYLLSFDLQILRKKISNVSSAAKCYTIFTSYSVTVSVGSVCWVYQSYFAENSCLLLQLETKLIRVRPVRMNQISKAGCHKTKQ